MSENNQEPVGIEQRATGHESRATACGARATSDEGRATLPPSCPRCCANCRCMMALENAGQTWLACPNRPGRQGRLTVVQPCDTCRDFEPKGQVQASADEGTRLIPLVNIDGLCAMVDPADYEWLRQYTWYAECKRGASYACTYGKGKRRPMHRMLMNPPAGLEVDHKNHNGLDNHRANLRNCTRQENCCNRRHATGFSGFRGVKRQGDKWQAWIRHRREVFPLGLFDDPAEAARARDRKARELHGEFAYLNFPNEGRIVGLQGTIRARSHAGGTSLQVVRAPVRRVRRRGKSPARGAGLPWGSRRYPSTLRVPGHVRRLCHVQALRVLASTPLASSRAPAGAFDREGSCGTVGCVLCHSTPACDTLIHWATAPVVRARPPNGAEGRVSEETVGRAHLTAAAETGRTLGRRGIVNNP